MVTLFLDVDGVLNSLGYFKTEYHLKRLDDWRDERRYPHIMINPSNVHWLNEICKSIVCKIIISSTWRKHYSLDKIVAALERNCFKYSYLIKDVTPVIGDRGAEIKKWLEENDKETLTSGNFAIIDDEVSEIHPYFPNSVFQTNNWHMEDGGLNEEVAKSFIEMWT